MKFKTKVLSAAILAAVGASSAQAITLASDGLGSVLVYPYYTVQGNYSTLISVVNTTSRAKAVKVRVLESLNSREVLDFNLYLSREDVWTAAIIKDPNGAGGAIKIVDASCTSPVLSGTTTPFRTEGFSGTAVGGLAADAEASQGLPRTLEGYVEIIEMGEIRVGTTLETNITHVANKPKDCPWVTQNIASWAPVGATSQLNAPTGGLAGSGTLIDVTGGSDFSYDPVVFAGYRSQEYHSQPGDLQPSLSDTTPAQSVVTWANPNGAVGVAVQTWATSPSASVNSSNALNATIMRSSVVNEFITKSANLDASTDWVVTFPTKRFHVDVNQTVAQAPFTKLFAKGGACEPISVNIWNQEEATTTTGVVVSPRPTTAGNALCWEANVLTFNGGNVLKSKNTLSIDTTGIPAVAGWARIGLDMAGHLLSNPGVGLVSTDIANGVLGTGIYAGLPAVGFAVQQYVNGNVNGVLANYGGLYGHKFERNIR